MDNTFASAVSCMDGRIQIPVIEYIKSNYAVQYVDMITEPGPNKILAENEDKILIESIRRRVAVSVTAHKSKFIAVIGHYDCAGNPVDEEIQKRNILASIETIKTWEFGIPIVGLWIDENWQVSAVTE